MIQKKDCYVHTLTRSKRAAPHTFSLQDVMAFNSEGESALPFPIIADDKRELSVQLGMLDPDERDKDGIPLTARCVSQPDDRTASSSQRATRSEPCADPVLSPPASGVCGRPWQEAEAFHPLPRHHRKELRWAAPSHRLPAAHCTEEGCHACWLEGKLFNRHASRFLFKWTARSSITCLNWMDYTQLYFLWCTFWTLWSSQCSPSLWFYFQCDSCTSQSS